MHRVRASVHMHEHHGYLQEEAHTDVYTNIFQVFFMPCLFSTPDQMKNQMSGSKVIWERVSTKQRQWFTDFIQCLFLIPRSCG